MADGAGATDKHETVLNAPKRVTSFGVFLSENETEYSLFTLSFYIFKNIQLTWDLRLHIFQDGALLHFALI